MKKGLHQFVMDDNTKLVSTPLAPHFKLSASMSLGTNEERGYMAKVLYGGAVGSLMYAMVCTWPEFHRMSIC